MGPVLKAKDSEMSVALATIFVLNAIVIDLFYGGCLSEELMSFGLSVQELRLCYLIRARLDNKTIALLFNIVPRSVLKAKQRIKNKLALSATDSLDMHIQQC